MEGKLCGCWLGFSQTAYLNVLRKLRLLTSFVFFSSSFVAFSSWSWHKLQTLGLASMNRISKYFSSDGGELFMYEQGGVFHSTGQSLSTAVWTDEETNKLCMYVTQNGKHNWEGAVEQLPNKTSFDCFIHYTNKADPELNWNEWTAEEEARLSELSNTHDDHNWCEIAEELGTGRTPFECLKHFQRNLNQRLVNNSDWTQDEDELLKLAVEEHGKNWQLVATLVPNRSATQCLNRWGKSTVCQEEMVAGKWSDEEERLLFLAALAYAAPRHSDGKKSEQELQNLLATGSPGLAHNGGSSKRAYSKWKEIAALVPGK